MMNKTTVISFETQKINLSLTFLFKFKPLNVIWK